MTLTKLAALIAGMSLAIASANLYAQTTVATDFQDAAVKVQPVSVPNGGVVIVNTNSNDNKNDSQAQADAASNAEAEAATAVESSVLSQSSADHLRNARKGAEIETEQKIVEKLEASRLEDERLRAERLFGNRFESNNKPVVIEKSAEIEVKKEVDIEAHKIEANKIEINKPVVVVEEPKKEVDVIVAAPVATVSHVAPWVPEVAVQRTYFSLNVGSTQYAASNVETQYSIGAAIGRTLDERWSIEARFSYSSYYVNTFWQAPLFTELDQYDFGLSTRFNILTGRFKPYVGGGLAYVYRSYQDRLYDNVYVYDPYHYDTAEASTNAVDASVMAGLDFEISRNFTIGAEASYTGNVFVKNDEPLFASQYYQPVNHKPLEEIERTSVMVNAKYSF